MCFIRIRPHHAPLTPPGAAPTLTKIHDRSLLGSTSAESSAAHSGNSRFNQNNNNDNNHRRGSRSQSNPTAAVPAAGYLQSQSSPPPPQPQDPDPDSGPGTEPGPDPRLLVPPMDTTNPTTERIRDSLDVTEFLEPIRTKSQEEVEQILTDKTQGMLAKGHG